MLSVRKGGDLARGRSSAQQDIKRAFVFVLSVRKGGDLATGAPHFIQICLEFSPYTAIVFGRIQMRVATNFTAAWWDRASTLLGWTLHRETGPAVHIHKGIPLILGRSFLTSGYLFLSTLGHVILISTQVQMPFATPSLRSSRQKQVEKKATHQTQITASQKSANLVDIVHPEEDFLHSFPGAIAAASPGLMLTVATACQCTRPTDESSAKPAATAAGWVQTSQRSSSRVGA